MKTLGTLRSPQSGMRGTTAIELLMAMTILIIVFAIVYAIIVSVLGDYTTQRRLIEAQNNARVTVDTLVRLLRMAGNDPQAIGFTAIDPDPDGNSSLDSIRLRADWNPPDAALDDPFEDVVFSTNNGVLFIAEAGNPPVEFLEDIGSLEFTYFDSDNVLITNPIADPDSIVSTSFAVQTDVPGSPPMIFTSSAQERN